MTINDMAATLREALEDERRELGFLLDSFRHINHAIHALLDIGDLRSQCAKFSALVL